VLLLGRFTEGNRCWFVLDTVRIDLERLKTMEPSLACQIAFAPRSALTICRRAMRRDRLLSSGDRHDEPLVSFRLDQSRAFHKQEEAK
jgi:hypothetical protein